MTTDGNQLKEKPTFGQANFPGIQRSGSAKLTQH